MEFRQIKTFLMIEKYNSFTKAALELGYAQSSITSQIQLLERELNVKLFERLGHNISLTPEGKMFLPLAEQMLRLSQDAKSIIGSAANPTGPLIIGAVESLCITRLPNLLKEYRLRYPEVEILIKFGTREEFLQALKDNSIDIAFFVDQPIVNNEFYTVLQMPEPMALLCTPEHPFAQRKEIRPEDISEEPMILTEDGCGYRQLFNTVMARYSVKPRSVIESGNVQVIKQLLLSGMGITFLPQTAVEEELQQKRVVKLNFVGPEFLIYTQALYHKTKWLSAALKAFVELLLDSELFKNTGRN